MLFRSREAMMRHQRFPNCISGVPSQTANVAMATINERRVVVSGYLVDYNSLAYEDQSPLPRRDIGRSVIPNFCFGSKVLLISRVRVAP